MDDDNATVAAGTKLSGLAAMAAFGVLLAFALSWFLLLAPRPDQTSQETEPDEKPIISGLSASKTIHFDMVCGLDDYRLLRTRPELKSTCVRLRRDRRRIVLLWLGDLQRDVHLVWEFRRFLVRNGLTVSVRDEFGIGFGVCLALICLGAARVAIFTCGPFALRKLIRNATLPVELLSNRAARLLACAPAVVRTQLEQKWAKHVLAWNPA